MRDVAPHPARCVGPCRPRRRIAARACARPHDPAAASRGQRVPRLALERAPVGVEQMAVLGLRAHAQHLARAIGVERRNAPRSARRARRPIPRTDTRHRRAIRRPSSARRCRRRPSRRHADARAGCRPSRARPRAASTRRPRRAASRPIRSARARHRPTPIRRRPRESSSSASR
ncbi:conserved hypothetical protein [Burkholderia pseudomallei Pakistan 9]|nr:conserved hypothetical protein [Burkholderia pseudomallei Pakistan 9]